MFIVVNEQGYKSCDHFQQALDYMETIPGKRPVLLMFENGTWYEVSFKRVAGI